MARTRKSIQPLNLLKYDVLIDDTSSKSDYFLVSQFDGYFYGGRNSFLIAGSNILKANTEILVEILDVDGNTVYSAPVSRFIEGNSRLVKIEVYSDTPIGPGKLVILGCATSYLDGRPIPQDWAGKYNVRWTSDIILSPLIENKTPLRFNTDPKIEVTEKFYNAPSSSIYEENITFPVDVQLSPKYFNIFPNGYLIELVGSSSNNEFYSYYKNGILTGSLRISSPSGVETASINLPISKIFNKSLAESTGSLITTTKNNIILNGFFSGSGSYNSNISPLGDVQITSSLNIKYSRLQTENTGSVISFAKIRLVDLSTTSGEIHKIRVSYKPSTEPGEFVTLGDVNTTVQELLSADSGSKIVQTGYFSDVAIDDYWYAATMSLQKNEVDPILPAYYTSSSIYTNLNLYQQSNVLLDAVVANVPISNQVYENNCSYFIGTTNTSSILLFPRSEYALSFQAFVTKTSASVQLNQSDYSLEVYLVPQEDAQGKLLDLNPLGQLVGTLTPSSTFSKQNFETVNFNFIPKINFSGNFGIRFVGYGGFWNIANVSLKVAEEPFFSSDEVDIILPNVNYYNKFLTFKTEYLDVNNNSIGLSTLSTPVYFYGSSAGSERSGASVTISTTPPSNAFNGDLWWNSEEGQLKIYYTDEDTSQWVDASGETIETGSVVPSTSISSSYALTSSYALNGASISSSYALTSSYALNSPPTLLQYDNSTLYSINPPALVSSSYYDLSIVLGEGAGDSSSIDNSIILGLYAGRYMDYTDSSVIIGWQAAEYIKNSTQLIAIGESATRYADGIGASVAMGIEALGAASASYQCTAIGTLAGSGMKFSDYVSVNGWRTGYGATSSSFSNFIGTYAGAYATASFSTFIGVKTGYQQSGRNNIIIGTDIGLPTGRNDSVNIGGIIFATGSYFNSNFVGPGGPFSPVNAPYTGSVNGKVGINVVNPQYALHASGTLGFSPGTSVTPIDNGDVVIEATNNTTLTFKLKGSDGVVRSGSITLT